MAELVDDLREDERQPGKKRTFLGKEMLEGMHEGIPLAAREIKRDGCGGSGRGGEDSVEEELSDERERARQKRIRRKNGMRKKR